jgi:hypothetical protein
MTSGARGSEARGSENEPSGATTNLLSRILSKNTTSIIVDYLTDPPPLCYINELEDKTAHILICVDKWLYYSNMEVDKRSKEIYHQVDIGIHRRTESMKWYLTADYRHSFMTYSYIH